MKYGFVIGSYSNLAENPTVKIAHVLSVVFNTDNASELAMTSYSINAAIHKKNAFC